MSSAIARISPRDVAGYRKFLEFSEAVFRAGYLKLGTVPFQSFWSMMRVAPQLIRLRSDRSVYSVVSDYMQDPHLRQAFSFQSLLIGGNPFHVSSIYALIHALERQWGVRFPRGGTGALVRAMVRLFQDLGGEVRLGCPVQEIRVRNGRATEVATADGRSVVVDAVASNADVVHTYEHLLAATDRGKAVAKSLTRKRFSNSLFVVYFGLKRQYPEIAHHTVLFGPALPGVAGRHLRPGRAARRFLALPAQPVAHGSVAGPARTGAASTCWRRCHTWGRRPSTGA